MVDYLAHFGILGMKWGVRRYQNPDGTLTEEGKRRYGKDSDSSGKPSKKVSEMSDEELATAISRMRNEKAYKDLMSDLYPEKVTLMDKILSKLKNETIPNTVSKIVMDTTSNFVSKYADAKLEDIINNKFESRRLKKESEDASNRFNAANKNQLADLLKDKYILPYNDKSDKGLSYTAKGQEWLDRQKARPITTDDEKKKDKK